ALTGRLPIEAPDAISLMVRVASEDPTPPKHYRPDLPRAISAALLRSLQKDPEARFKDAAAFAEALYEGRKSRPDTRQPSAELPSDEATGKGAGRRVRMVVVERVLERAPMGFVGRAVEALRAAGAMAEPLQGGRVAAVFGADQQHGPEVAGRAVLCALTLR